MKKYLVAILAVVVALVFTADCFADSGTPSTRKRETWTAKQTFKEGILMKDEALEMQNKSNAKTFGIDPDTGKPDLSWKSSYVTGVTMIGTGTTGNTSYTMTSANDLYIFTVSSGSYPAFLPTQVSGVSVYMPTGSAALDGFKLHVAAHPMDTYYSGTSDICFVPANDSVQGKGVTDFIVSASGITNSTATADVFAYNLIDNEAETVTFVYEWAVSGGTWWQVDIQ